MERFDLSVANVTGALPEGAIKERGISLAIGFFDGVHLGHQEVVRQAVALAREQGLVPAVMTFDPHPRVVLGHGSQYQTVLTPLTDKLSLLSELGVEAAYIIRFDRSFSEVTAEQFVKTLINPLNVKATTIGFDFAFGHRGEGNAETLRLHGTGDAQVQVVPPVFLEGNKVSSTRIRDRLAEGASREATELLGRPYVIKGEVVHGDARGRLLGFPTANLSPEQSYVIPRSGVYAIHIDVLSNSGVSEGRYNGVLNVGYRPTFDAPGGALKLEAHLFDFAGDLYGRQLALTFHTFLRAEKKFESIDQLVAQISSDSGRAREIFSVIVQD
ncbi:bifunctional riboflavin kinase/FAD synthetase [Cohnella cholangitidis]|uniref:Riboflavin biosynthesis protein n=1 Tax=Cohnella cholangitidis TaxID=2598458 RepID=A0A7G5BT36_9BACL|nr:bifunctional riboflavin kinase/FAD synthetase [Cohnella cholangitidis]QMV40120.1 bifunctional riboflavin kinase/FAD synthetase [Cohnella cholangitidis]